MMDSRFPLATVVAFGLLIPASLGAQSVETRIERVAERIEQSRADDMNIIAPRLFERAEDRLADARRRYDQGGRIDDIDRSIDEALEALDEAEDLAPVGRAVLGGALTARVDALEARAPDYAAEDWERAEKSARDAGRRIEGNDQAGAGEKADRAESEYRDAELNAIRADVLGRTRVERNAALELKADRLSPVLFSGADSLVDAAEAVLSGDRYQASSAGALAEEAAEAYRHAARLAGLADSISRKRLTVEAVALRGEEQVRRITEALQFEARFTEGAAAAVDDALVAIESLYGDRDALRRDLELRATEIERLDRSVDSLDARLAELELREAAVSAELRERQRREQRFREVEAIFSPAEGEVLRSEDRLILRLAGLTFPSGSAEIRPDNFAVLTKVQRAIREFPEARIVVEGHTDSQGNESLNQNLSRRRAIAVREYLLSNIAMSADRITALGYGESRPVAPNNTEAGRTRNRRIEITLTFDGT
ncbi:MAG: OmpA family protein [Gemmatimonadetes bacterium]|nr:OmpA family protein [Gemmatimonadota bacterium]NNK49363.1 OmpA family protein [Gemmatimonadota bacterium]